MFSLKRETAPFPCAIIETIVLFTSTYCYRIQTELQEFFLDIQYGLELHCDRTTSEMRSPSFRI
jgi:hypothetical protein